jgi:hypothetical protein
MSFRKIRPSNFADSASPSTPSQSTTTSEGTGNDPRHLRRAGTDIDTEGVSTAATTIVPPSSSQSNKRRRVPDSVTRNACLNCKKARAKVCSRSRDGMTLGLRAVLNAQRQTSIPG